MRLRDLARTEPAALDAVLATALLVAALVSLGGEVTGTTSPRTAGWLGYLLVVLGVAPYYVRRRWPLPVLLAAAVPVVAMTSLGITPGVLGAGLFIACYTVGAWSSRRALVAAAVIVGSMLVAIHVAWPDRLSYLQLVENLVLFATSFALGEATRARREASALAAARAELLELHQEELARQRITDERLRLARELHDVVAHSLGVIAVQAGVGAHVMDEEPEEARRALEAIATTSRESLTEVRALLGVLRGDEVEYAPQPGLADLESLVDRIRRAGIVVDCRQDVATGTLPEGLDRAAYAVLQEALTNVVRHAPGARAEVRVTDGPERLVLDVVDDGGPGGVLVPSGGGSGLAGMRERVRVWGGQVEVGPRPGGGFGVHVVLPRATAS